MRRTPGTATSRRVGDDAFVLVVVLWTGLAMMMLATASATLAWMAWSGARYEDATLRARAHAEGAVLRLEAVLDAHRAAGSPRVSTPPDVPTVDGVEVRVVTFRWRSDEALELEIEAVVPPARVVAGSVWAPW